MNQTDLQAMYGYGILNNLVAVGKNSMLPLKEERTDKQMIYTDAKLKVDPIKGTNYFKEYMNDPTSKQNFDQQEDHHLEEGMTYLESLPNINLDYDNDGVPDHQYGEPLSASSEEEDYDEDVVNDDMPVEPLKEKSLEVKDVEKPIIESTAKLMHNDDNSNVQPNRDEKLKNTDTGKFNISMSEGVIMGSGLLASALMLFGRNASK